ncbi:MAG: ABC transporter ATP-binding protein [Longimicrobiaceae bacterium]
MTYQEEDRLGKAYDAGLMRRLLGYLKPYRGRVALAIVLLLATSALELVGPWLTVIALDRAVPEGDLTLLAWLAGLYALSLVAGFLLEYAEVLLTTWLGQRVMYDLRTRLFAHLQRLSLRFFDKNPVGRLMTRVTNDVEALNELFSSGVVTVFGDLFTLTLILGAMFALNWRLALVTCAVLPLVFVVAFVFRGLIRKAYREIRVRLARINAYLQERLGGMSVVHLFGQEESSFRRFDRINRDHLDSHLRSITYYALFFPVIEVLTAVALALILWYGGGEILRDLTTVGVLAAFVQYARRFFRPIQDLSEKYNLLQQAMAASERVFHLLDTRPEIEDAAGAIPLPDGVRGEVEFRDVWFRYDDRSDWVLKGVSFRATPGERLAMVGATGAGKTTIINLLLRFYRPQRGEISIDGVPLERITARELRARVALVLQDVFLFSEEVGYNIRLDNPRVGEKEMRAAAARVGADRFIERLPRGYAEPLGERGASLSVGERQLVSFARALAFDPLILVLDEATSSVDSELEARIEEALKELMRGRTSLVIAHRLSTVQGADQILVLHHGEIRERGNHGELLERGGLYARLHELQFAAGRGGGVRVEG